MTNPEPERSVGSEHVGPTGRASSGPAGVEFDGLATAEREAYEEWLAGPRADERAAWAEGEQRRRFLGLRSWEASVPSDEEVRAWADRERRRRAEWDARTAAGFRDRRPGPTARVSTVRDPAEDPRSWSTDRSSAERRLQREAQLFSQGLWSWLVRAPYACWAAAVDAGEEWENGTTERSRPRRVPFYDD